MKWSVPAESMHCRIERIGRDWMIVLTGGIKKQDHHIGAATIAYRVHDATSDKVKWSLMTQGIPGHKESSITETLAMEAAQMLEPYGGNIMLTAGIHYESLTKEQIDAVVHTAHQLLHDQLQQVCVP